MTPPNAGGTAVATLPASSPQSAIERLITSDRARKFIEPFLPEGTDIRRVAATVARAIAADETKTLKKCTPESLVLGVSQIQQWGLELAPGVAYLLPFKNNKKVGEDGKPVYEATPCADYKALAAMMVASGAVRHVEAREVREGDRFEYHFGLDATIVHQPQSRAGRETKPITHVYCILHLPFQARAFDVMSAEQVDAIRKHYSKQHKEGPLKAFYAKKTIIRQMAKTMPKDRRLAKFFDVLEKDAALEADSASATTAAIDSDDDERPRVAAGAVQEQAGEARTDDETDLDGRWIAEQD
jgi:phage RecT family recombinase